MKVKSKELTGAALDWAVAQADGSVRLQYDSREGLIINNILGWISYRPSVAWQQGGPIIERECITVRPVFHAERTENGSDVYRQDGWAAHVEPKAFWITPRPFTGPTPLIAAMRAYVASMLGEEVEIPEELK